MWGLSMAPTVPPVMQTRGPRASRHTRVFMKLRIAVLTLACSAGLAGVAGAQRKGDDDIPKAYRPPPGMCRIWLDKVPPKQQPAPTDCPTAVRNKPPNGKVIFGDDYVEKPRKPDERELPFLKKFTDGKKTPDA